MRYLPLISTAMLSRLDKFLNNITMYRLVLYYLIALLAYSGVLTFFHALTFNPVDLMFSVSFLLVISLIANYLFSRVYHVNTNVESVYITSLILALIITPVSPVNVTLLFWLAVLSQASKYVLVFHKKHIFNPAAVAVFLTGLVLNFPASWWVGTASMLPPVAIGGFLIIRKIRRWDLVFGFLLVNLFSTLVYTAVRGYSPLSTLPKAILDSPLIFFVSIMLTEPLTTPPDKLLRSLYGSAIGLLMVFTAPETALMIGNILSFILSPQSNRNLTLKEVIRLSPDIYDFIFSPDHPLSFSPGQYLEWTVNPKKSDDRGNRRYFTIASSPTEKLIHVGVRFSRPSSSFKSTLLSLSPGQQISAGHLAGDFTLPENRHQKLAFIAGGVGITPFRSMIKYLVDRNESRPITLFYQSKSDEDFVYSDVFTAAEKLNIRTVYNTSRLLPESITSVLPGYADYIYYLSGPSNMVDAYRKMLLEMHVPRYHIKTDYFPGY